MATVIQMPEDKSDLGTGFGKALQNMVGIGISEDIRRKQMEHQAGLLEKKLTAASENLEKEIRSRKDLQDIISKNTMELQKLKGTQVGEQIGKRGEESRKTAKVVGGEQRKTQKVGQVFQAGESEKERRFRAGEAEKSRKHAERMQEYDFIGKGLMQRDEIQARKDLQQSQFTHEEKMVDKKIDADFEQLAQRLASNEHIARLGADAQLRVAELAAQSKYTLWLATQEKDKGKSKLKLIEWYEKAMAMPENQSEESIKMVTSLAQAAADEIGVEIPMFKFVDNMWPWSNTIEQIPGTGGTPTTPGAAPSGQFRSLVKP